MIRYWGFSFSISPSSEYSGLTSFRIGLFDSLLSKELSRVFSSTMVLKHWFFGIQPSLWSKSHLYMMAGKSIALTMWTFVSKVMSLLFNMLPRLVIAFLPRNKHLLISRLQSPSAVTLQPKKVKFVTVSIVLNLVCIWKYYIRRIMCVS